MSLGMIDRVGTKASSSWLGLIDCIRLTRGVQIGSNCILLLYATGKYLSIYHATRSPLCENHTSRLLVSRQVVL